MKEPRSLLSLILFLCVWVGERTIIAAQPGRVVVWGSNFAGATNVPPGLTNVISIAAGPSHCVALKSEGTVAAWGRSTFTPPGLSNVTAIAAAENYSMALKSDGTVVTWGSYGWSGSPAAGAALLSNVVAIAAGWSHSLALQNDGTLLHWNENGVPTVSIRSSEITAIAAGFGSTLALLEDGTVLGWRGLSNITAVSSGSGAISLALRSDGTVIASGRFPDYYNYDPPASLSNVVAISAGGICDYDCTFSSAALRSDGTVVGWGACPSSPAGLTNVVAIAAGTGFTMGIVVDPPPVPSLNARVIGNEVILSWPTNATGFLLQRTSSLVSPVGWVDVINSGQTVMGENFEIAQPLYGREGYYRLRKP